MENDQISRQSSKEKKRHNSTIIPSSLIENFSQTQTISDNDNNSICTFSATVDPSVFHLSSNSLFAYQEFDQFSSLCDGSENQNNNKIEEKFEMPKIYRESLTDSKKDIINMDEVTKNKNEIKNKKRKSAFGTLPMKFDLGFNQNIYTEYNNMKNNNNLNNIQNNNNALINNFRIENVNNLQNTNVNIQNRRNSSGFVQFYQNPFLIQNYGGNINNFNPMFYINNNNNNQVQFQNSNIEDNSNDNKNNNNLSIIMKDTICHKKRRSMILPNNSMINPLNNIYLQKIPTQNFLDQRKNNPNIQIPNNIILLFQDQINCKNFQENLEFNKNDINYSRNFYEGIKPEIVNLIEHQFGNYVIQKFFEVLIYQENKKLFAEIFIHIDEKNKLYEISIHNYGTRVIQKTLDKLINNNYKKIESNELNNSFKKLINNHLYNLCCDKNGNHVYQKLIRAYPKESNDDFIYDNLCEHILEIALLQQGATIFHVILDFANYKQKEKIILYVNPILPKLINDKYGNYTIQSILNNMNNEIELIEPIYKYISENILELSLQKFSSNVIDTFIMKNNLYSKKLIEDIINKKIIQDIIKDQFGNYVIQKALMISEKNVEIKIIKQIKPIMDELKQNSVGKKIYEKLMQQYSQLFKKD